MTLEHYDFSKPSRLPNDFEQRLGAWLREGCGVIPGKWARTTGVRLEMVVRGLEIGRPGQALARLEESTVGYQVAFEPAGLLTLATLPRSVALLLVSSALGDAGPGLGTDRELTVVEESLCEFAVQDLLLTALQETWPGTESMQLALRANGKPA